MKVLLLSAGMLVLTGSSVLANVGFFGGAGHMIALSTTEQFRLVSEEITISPFFGPSQETDVVAFRCRFVLRNLSSTRTTIQVGFPLDDDSGNVPLDPLAVSSASSTRDCDDTDEVISYRFIARDEHSTYHVRHVRGGDDAKYRELFVWDMTFAPEEERTLRVAYVLPLSTTLASTPKDEKDRAEVGIPRYRRQWYSALEWCILKELTYTTETGKSWNGPIGSATFRVVSHPVAFWMRERQSVYVAAVDTPQDARRLQQLYHMKVGLVYLQRSSGNWKDDDQYGSVTMSIQNYEPDAPIRFSWFGTCLPSNASECDAVVRQLMGPRPQAIEVLELVEIVEAFCGIAPKTDSVKEFVERQVWYHPRNNLTRLALSDEQRETLSRLEMIAKDGLAD